MTTLSEVHRDAVPWGSTLVCVVGQEITFPRQVAESKGGPIEFFCVDGRHFLRAIGFIDAYFYLVWFFSPEDEIFLKGDPCQLV